MDWASFWIGLSIIPMTIFAVIVLLIATYFVTLIVLVAGDKKSKKPRPGPYETFDKWRKARKKEDA